MAGKIYVSNVTALVDMGDHNYVNITKDVTRVREGHALLKGREHLFREIDVHYDVEDARQAPQDEPKPQPVAAASAKAATAEASGTAEPATAEDEEYLAPPAKKAPARRGPRKAPGSGS